jgi:hypothetical protein
VYLLFYCSVSNCPSKYSVYNAIELIELDSLFGSRLFVDWGDRELYLISVSRYVYGCIYSGTKGYFMYFFGTEARGWHTSKSLEFGMPGTAGDRLRK